MSITRTSAPICSATTMALDLVREEVPKQGRVQAMTFVLEAHFLHGHGADHDGKSGVHTAGDANYAVVKPCVLHALYKAGDLDIKHTLAVGGQILCLFRQVRVLLVSAGEGGVSSSPPHGQT